MPSIKELLDETVGSGVSIQDDLDKAHPGLSPLVDKLARASDGNPTGVVAVASATLVAYCVSCLPTKENRDEAINEIIGLIREYVNATPIGETSGSFKGQTPAEA